MPLDIDFLNKLNQIDVVNTGGRPDSVAAAIIAVRKAGSLTRIPRTLAENLYNRILASTDPKEIAFLAKAFDELQGYAVLDGNFYFTTGNLDLTGNQPFPTIPNTEIKTTTGYYVFGPGTYTLTREMFPLWYRNNTHIRFRLWGAGGGGGAAFYDGNNTTSYSTAPGTSNQGSGASSAGGGGGGGYAEMIFPLSSVIDKTLTVGAGGTTFRGTMNNMNINADGGSGGSTSFLICTATGGNGGASARSTNDATHNTINATSGRGGTGVGGLLNATGGNGASPTRIGEFLPQGQTQNTSSGVPQGGPGGSAAGPWGNGRNAIKPNALGSNVIVSGPGTGASGSVITATASTSFVLGGTSLSYQTIWGSTILPSYIGGTPQSTNSNPGCGGAGVGDTMYMGKHGGHFGGGGTVGRWYNGNPNDSTQNAVNGNGGIAAGGAGGRTYYQVYDYAAGGFGGNGMAIVEFFIR